VASTITNYSDAININFPIPGVDNDSQGFRTNFAKVQSALAVASTEISNLQLTTTNTSDLTLNNHTSSELYNLGDVNDGTIVWLTDVNKPAYYFGSTWYTFTGTSVTLNGNSVTDTGDINCPGILTTYGLGVSGNTIIQGTLAVQSSEALTNGGAASLQKTSSYFTTTSSGWTSTLAAGDRSGLIKTFMMAGDGGGDMVITITNAGWKSSGAGTITFNDIGDGCTLQYINSKWYCVGQNGVVFG
jgi:hypothetical protein